MRSVLIAVLTVVGLSQTACRSGSDPEPAVAGSEVVDSSGTAVDTGAATYDSSVDYSANQVEAVEVEEAPAFSWFKPWTWGNRPRSPRVVRPVAPRPVVVTPRAYSPAPPPAPRVYTPPPRAYVPAPSPPSPPSPPRPNWP